MTGDILIAFVTACTLVLSRLYSVLTRHLFPVHESRLLGLVVTEPVVYLVLYGIGEILLFYPVTGKIVGIFIELTFYFSICAVIMFILEL